MNRGVVMIENCENCNWKIQQENVMSVFCILKGDLPIKDVDKTRCNKYLEQKDVVPTDNEN